MYTFSSNLFGNNNANYIIKINDNASIDSTYLLLLIYCILETYYYNKILYNLIIIIINKILKVFNKCTVAAHW